MTKSKIFLILSLSFLAGIFAASFLDVGFLNYFFLLVAVAALVLGYRSKIGLAVFFAILFFSFGIWKMQSALENIQSVQANGNIKFSGTAMVVREPEDKEFYQEIVVKGDTKGLKGMKGGEERDIEKGVEKEKRENTMGDFKILVQGEKYQNLKYGDEVELKCALEKPENFFSDFDYRMYLAKNKIFYVCKRPEVIKKTGKNSGNFVFSEILKLKNSMEKNNDRVIPQPEAALANGLLFGGNNRLSEEWREKFVCTGTSHIVAVSGYNVTIIAEYLIWFGILLGLWRPKAFWFALIGIFLFVAMIGFPSSAVRAGVMGSILLWAAKNGRLANSRNAIVFSAAVMLAINPLSLRWDVGFQLSFLATLGIVETAPFWEKYFDRKIRSIWFLEIAIMTLSAQIFVLPIIIFNFHSFSWVFLLANIAVLEIIPATMLLVFLAAVSGFVFLPLSMTFSFLAYILLKYETGAIDFLSRLSWASREVGNFGWQMVVAYYVLIGGTIWIGKNKLNRSNKTSKIYIK